MSQKIQEALSKLDVTNDNHWTADGLPRLDTVKMLANESTLTREAVSAAVPGFTRTSAAQGVQAPAPAATPATPPPVQETPPVAPQAAPTPEPKVEEPPPVVKTEVTPTPVINAVSAEIVKELEGDSVTTADLLAVAQEELAELAVIKAQVEAQYTAKMKQVDALIVQAEKEKVGDTNAEAIREYLARQVQIGQERAARIQALKGIDLKSILPSKAPIDVAMARRSTRGRPVRGV